MYSSVLSAASISYSATISSWRISAGIGSEQPRCSREWTHNLLPGSHPPEDVLDDLVLDLQDRLDFDRPAKGFGELFDHLSKINSVPAFQSAMLQETTNLIIWIVSLHSYRSIDDFGHGVRDAGLHRPKSISDSSKLLR